MPGSGTKTRPPLSAVSSSSAVLNCSGCCLCHGIRMPVPVRLQELQGADGCPRGCARQLLDRHAAEPGELEQPFETGFGQEKGVLRIQVPPASQELRGLTADNAAIRQVGMGAPAPDRGL